MAKHRYTGSGQFYNTGGYYSSGYYGGTYGAAGPDSPWQKKKKRRRLGCLAVLISLIAVLLIALAAVLLFTDGISGILRNKTESSSAVSAKSGEKTATVQQAEEETDVWLLDEKAEAADPGVEAADPEPEAADPGVEAADPGPEAADPEPEAVNRETETLIQQDEPAADPYDSSLYWYYGQLTEAEKTVYAEFVDAVRQCADSFEPSEKLSVDESVTVAGAVYGDHPELFWWQQQCTYWHSDGKVEEIELKYEFSAAELPAAQAAFDDAAREILVSISGLRDYEQERIAHDTLCAEITYTYTSRDQSAYGALVDRACVCSGYARAMQYLMAQVGVPCYYVTGEGYGGTDPDNKSWDSHAWNVICLQGEFYDLDVTFDDRDDWGANQEWDDSWGYALSDIYCGYENYNLTDDEFTPTHIAAAECAGMPACTSTACSYENLYGESGTCGMLRQMGLEAWYTVYSLQDYYSAVENGLSGLGSGTYRFDFMVEGDETLQEIIEANDSGAFWDELGRYIETPNGAECAYWKLETDDGEDYLALRITIK